jgi:(S)-ureidoglycine aminohydrolase
MEHGLFVLEGKGVYRLNDDWVEVEAGDFMWLRAFCPQACYAGGPGPFRYLLYKDVNRQVRLTEPVARGQFPGGQLTSGLFSSGDVSSGLR